MTPEENERAEILSEMVARGLPGTIAVIIYTKTGYHVSHATTDEVLLVTTQQVADDLRHELRAESN